MFAAPPIVKTEIFARFPKELLVRPGRKSLLEGPSFDRDGNLYVVNVWHGQVLRISPSGEFSLVAQYDGEPSGLKIDREGRIFVTDHKLGLLTVDPQSGSITVLADRPQHERFKGLGDLVFNSQGDLFFTDQGESGHQDPTGGLYRRSPDGKLKLLLNKIPSPNGLVPSPDERILYVAATRANAVWRVPIRHDDTLGRVGTYIQLSGGIGPDGLALDEAGNLAVAHAGMGSVWLFGETGRPIAEVRSCAGNMTTNMAYGGPDRTSLYITEAETGSILVAKMEIPGRKMFSHLSANES